MDRSAARAVLGVAAEATPAEVRRAFRRLLLEHHPDVSGAVDGAATRRLTEAYRTLTDHQPTTPTSPATPANMIVDGDTLVLDLPPDEAFLRLLDAATSIGDVTYVDAETGLLEARVAFDDGGTASLLVSLQGRGPTTDAFFTLEPPERLHVVIAALADEVTG